VTKRGNVEVARSAMDAMKRGDADAMDGLAHADYEFQTTSALPNAGVYAGLDSVMSFSREFDETWETFSLEEQEVRERGDTVVILGRASAKGKSSGVALETSVGYVHTLRDGKLARTQVFFDHADAIEAAGVAQPPASTS
jgi:ketosteroid isomerase-like protein